MKKVLIITISLLISGHVFSQDSDISNWNPIPTGVNFIINPINAQIVGFGDIGVVSSPNYYQSGLTQNPALLSRNEKVIGVTGSHGIRFQDSKILKQRYDFEEIDFNYSLNEKNSLGTSLKYFSFGEVTATDANGNILFSHESKELEMRLRYARSFSENLSLGIGLSYIYSDIIGKHEMSGYSTQPGKSLALDLGFDYRNTINLKKDNLIRYDFGGSIENIGNKISYISNAESKDFIPTYLRLGTMWSFNHKINEKLNYSVDAAYQADKLLVPTPPVWAIDLNTGTPMKDAEGNYIILKGKDPNVSVFRGLYQSFYDSPDGFKEEMHEIIHHFGIENRFEFQNELSLALRIGRLSHHKYKGNSKQTMIGLGVNYKSVYFNITRLKYDVNSDFNNYFTTTNISDLFLSIGFLYHFKEK